MPYAPWASGPAEILQHGLSLLAQDSDKNRRLAMLSIDNGVELTLKTYLGLPRRVTGINLGRKKFQEISESFPSLLDAIETTCSNKITGIDLGEIEWYHRLRNELYHQGNGLTVEKQKVEMYALLAKQLFELLFDTELKMDQTPQQNLLGQFLEGWVRLERAATTIAYNRGIHDSHKNIVPPLTIIKELKAAGIITDDEQARLYKLRQIRNQVVHGPVEHQNALNVDMLRSLETIIGKLEQVNV